MTQGNVWQTICVTAWTAAARPTVERSARIKRELLAAQGLPGWVGDYQLDQRVPLEVGGDPDHLRIVAGAVDRGAAEGSAWNWQCMMGFARVA